uniref:Nudix hydrolase domain-containing protein n=1 Tax=Setaria digitata TaxID=48799 RepID=A0A915Q0X2_9BILA
MSVNAAELASDKADKDDDGSRSDVFIDMQLGTYVTVGVIFREVNDGNLELLLTQEAKRRCLGKWYIPAGHVEPGETIMEGVIREVMEETGYKCEPKELLSVQVQGSGWYRFSFYCSIIGGERKMIADNESLGADWFAVDEVMAKKVDLRSSDFLKIVEEAQQYHRQQQRLLANKLSRFLPIPVAVDGLFIEFAILRTVKATRCENILSERIEILVHKNISDDVTLATVENAFPTVEFDFHYFFPMVILKCFQHGKGDKKKVIPDTD